MQNLIGSIAKDYLELDALKANSPNRALAFVTSNGSTGGVDRPIISGDERCGYMLFVQAAQARTAVPS